MKVIGVTPLYDDEKNSCWMLPGYTNMLEKLGAVPVVLPLTANRKVLDYFLHICKGFLFTGGHDVSPQLYHAQASEKCGVCCPVRDAMEEYLLRKAVEQDKSVFGICRGMQLMNACFGGTLYQDLPSERPGTVEHHMRPPYDRAVHKVDIRPGTLFGELLGDVHVGVNSYHHQAIRTLSPLFEEMARSEDGLVEAISMPGKKYVAGVQWHPEYFYEADANSVIIVKSFVDSVE